MPNPTPTLRFEYCDCGCKSYVANAGSLTFAIFDDLKGTFYLSSRHTGIPGDYGQFRSYDQAKQRAIEIAIPHVKQQYDSLKRSAEQLGVA